MSNIMDSFNTIKKAQAFRDTLSTDDPTRSHIAHLLELIAAQRGRIMELERALVSDTQSRLEEAEEILRDLASYVGNGGHNAPDPIDLNEFHKKILDGIDNVDGIDNIVPEGSIVVNKNTLISAIDRRFVMNKDKGLKLFTHYGWDELVGNLFPPAISVEEITKAAKEAQDRAEDGRLRPGDLIKEGPRSYFHKVFGRRYK